MCLCLHDIYKKTMKYTYHVIGDPLGDKDLVGRPEGKIPVVDPTPPEVQVTFPQTLEAGDEDEDTRTGPEVAAQINPRKIEILNKGLQFGCKWAIEEAERLEFEEASNVD